MFLSRLITWSLVIGLAILPVSQAAARTIEGVQFPESLRAGPREMNLQGAGLLRYKVIFRGYVAALYQQAPISPDTNGSQDKARRLEIEYFWDIPANEFQKATVEGIRKNTDAEKYESLRDQIDTFNQFYRDVESGDRYSLTYLPDRGTELALNGEPLGTMPGQNFATALFGIWLGDQPLDESLKKKLLGEETS